MLSESQICLEIMTSYLKSRCVGLELNKVKLSPILGSMHSVNTFYNILFIFELRPK